LVTTVGASLLRRLVRGRYRIVVVATDAAGNRSRAVSTVLKVAR